jgi:amino acid adenylation domain-containing protein
MSLNLLQTHPDRISGLWPGRQAATDGQLSLSFRDLDLQSNALARCLAAHGAGRGQHVVLCMARSPLFIVAMLGALKADAVYIPIPADAPSERRSKIMDDCRPQAMICDQRSRQKMFTEGSKPGLPPIWIVLGEEPGIPGAADHTIIGQRRLRDFAEGPLSYNNGPDDIACLFYTSGSTGRPKGVMLSHRNIGEYARWAVDYIGISEQDRLLGTAPFHFDMSLFDIYSSLITGASLCIANEKLLLFPSLLVDFAEAEQVTAWKGVSSLLVYLARTNAISQGRLPTLRKILFSGEVFSTKYLIQWMNTFPDKIFYNAYGPTEATGISMYHRVDQIPRSANERVPLGKACENTEIYLLDDNKETVPRGESGELYIKGPCVASGYFSDPEKTKAAFIDDPLNPGSGEKVYRTGDYARLRPDGNYEFLGRKDDQIKYMGYRIELADIEQSLVSIPGVCDAGAILAGTATDELNELIAYVDLDDAISLPAVIGALKEKLPHYMIPRRIIRIPRLPRSESGKLDRQGLLLYHLGTDGRP